MTLEADNVIDIWTKTIGGPIFAPQPATTQAVLREALHETWEQARRGSLEHWQLRPKSMLALLILLDQYPRMMARNERERLASDRIAIGLAKKAVASGFDTKLTSDMRRYFYFPLMHSESQTDQDMCVRLCASRSAGNEALEHAKARRTVIRRFGRFPDRNHSLGRTCTETEKAYLAEGGLAAMLGLARDSGRH